MVRRMMGKTAHRVTAAALMFLVFAAAGAQPAIDIKAAYAKSEVMITMRDGVRLFTSIYAPKDTSRSYPILMTRTPYSCAPYGEENFPDVPGNQRARYFRDGYIIVYQDVRGRYMSEGTFEDVRPVLTKAHGPKDIDETTDTYDTVDWLVKNVPHNNGRVGISGISYPGFYTWMGTINAHPAVKATSPQAPVSQWMSGDDFFHNGAFLLPHAFNFYYWFGWPRSEPTTTFGRFLDEGTPDEYEFFLRMGALPNANRLYMHDSVAFWNVIMKHGRWSSFWQDRSVLPHLKNLTTPTLVVGGWFDTENLYGALNSYKTKEKNSPRTANNLVMGPWFHGQWNANRGDSLGVMAWGSATSEFYTDSVEAPFFEHYLKGGPAPNLAEATVFNTGSHAWARFNSWPPAGGSSKKLYLREDGGLSFAPPKAAKREYDEYVSDPSHPVPYTNEIRGWYNPSFMLEDQRFASRRPDVLTYQTEPLTEDVTIAGPIDVNLVGSTSGTDCDWVVKLIDVFPGRMPGEEETPFSYGGTPRVPLGGYEMLVRGDVLRGKFRNGLDQPGPLTPNVASNFLFRLNDAFHTFQKGHRIMVQVQSTWFPMIDRNPGSFLDIYSASDSDFHPTTQRVYRSSKRPSYLLLNILN